MMAVRSMQQPSVSICEAALFSSAVQAVRFAITQSGQPKRPASSRMLDATRARREFSALDQAAQAGMILNIVEGAGSLGMAIMIASTAPRSLPCECKRPCCSGKAINFEWHRAINAIAQAAPTHAKYMLRVACVLKIFGASDSSYRKIAEELSVDQETVSKHHKIILRWLRGAKGSKGEPPSVGIESTTWSNAEDALRASGIVG